MTRRPAEAQTAFGPIVIAAAEQMVPPEQRLFEDDLAVRFLPPGMRLAVHASRWPFVRTLLIKMTESRGRGLWGGMLCRKRYADDQVERAIKAGLRQFVFLGTGLDTRAYRLVAPAGAAAFEVDLPANIAMKGERLREIYGGTPGGVTLVPLDFETHDLGHALTTNGLRPELPMILVWEAVTQYLTEDGVRRTLSALAGAAPGSRFIFTYVLRDFLDGVRFYGAEKAHREFVAKRGIWRLGLAPGEVADLLAEYGWAEREQVGAAEYLARYVKPSGRDLAVSEIERFVYAEKDT
ncbi:methyltransferase (TIGR00027 family) [Thermocatellispora tengchongensis]|uniref:S-adenosyl-L-methionine-dependent methyltransferase n=1 Tax=Thermocatellispora tengchongensis TaxID=1073253 RepID=A0A840PN34_9ACTN|nr:SAM-dependent methyltransferase [Thermocatellispora tengchongensis]MBB5137445.1 methyltransferase (TIGR00027 family) [Thermocatellispora tengchongensis]